MGSTTAERGLLPASFWIDFVLLPESLEDHLNNLKSGAVSQPSAVELITAFLEQAATTRARGGLENDSVRGGNEFGPSKDQETPSTTRTPGGGQFSSVSSKTAELLCERAARVAVVMELTLEELEAHVPLPLQEALLRALIRHDNEQTLRHRCDLRRWILHIVLNWHPVGSASPSVVGVLGQGTESRGGISVGEGWRAGGSAGVPGPTPVEEPGATRPGQPFSTEGQPGDPVINEGGAIEFLRTVLDTWVELESPKSLAKEGSTKGELQSTKSLSNGKDHEGILANGLANGTAESANGFEEGPIIDQNEVKQLGVSYIQQLLYDLGEVHFMHGHVPFAQGYFSKVFQLFDTVSKPKLQRGRVVGYLLACSVLHSVAEEGNGEIQREDNRVLQCELARQSRNETKGSKRVRESDDSTPNKRRKGESAVFLEVSMLKALEEDNLKPNLSQGYRTALSRDTNVPEVLRAKVTVSNVIREVLQGAPVETLLQAQEGLEKHQEAAEYALTSMRHLANNKPATCTDQRTSSQGSSCLRDLAHYLCCLLGESKWWKRAHELGLLESAQEEQDEAMEEELPAGGAEADVSNEEVAEWPRESSKAGPHDPSSLLQALIRAQTESQTTSTVHTLASDPSDSSNLSKAASILHTRGRTLERSGASASATCQAYSLALSLDNQDPDSLLKVWLQNTLTDDDSNPDLTSESSDRPISYHVLEEVMATLSNHERWGELGEVSKWAASCTSKTPPHRLLQLVRVSAVLGDLMPLCSALQAAVAKDQFNENAARLGTATWGLFEDLMTYLAGGNLEESLGVGKAAKRGGQPGGVVPAPPYPQGVDLPLIKHLANGRVLQNLACLTAGWLHRCHQTRLAPWPLAVERYGMLAGVTAGASVPTPSQEGSSNRGYRHAPPKVAPAFGTAVFEQLLRRLVELPGIVEGDPEKGHRWLLGLGDLAFEREAYAEAVQLYIQAGEVRSSHFTTRGCCISRDVYTPWVVRRMIAACKALGAPLQAAVLCQCLPVPDFETAFRVLQEAPTIGEGDANAYFECIWEVPILELLVFMHSRGGDEARVAQLIKLLQHPALNVHNPPPVRAAHIAMLEQRFMQRLRGEFLVGSR